MFTRLERLALWDVRLRLQVAWDATSVHDGDGIAPWANLPDAMPA